MNMLQSDSTLHYNHSLLLENQKYMRGLKNNLITADNIGSLISNKLLTVIDYLVQASSKSMKGNFPLVKWIESTGKGKEGYAIM